MLPLILIICLLPVGNGQAQQAYPIPNREELQKRVEYADQHFREGTTPGSKTDRGKVYIGLGPPDDIRKARDPKLPTGVGLPFENWTYRGIPGIGTDIEIEFIDKYRNGIYKYYSPQRIALNETQTYIEDKKEYDLIQKRIQQTFKMLPSEQNKRGKEK